MASYTSLLKKLPEEMVINWNRRRIDQNVEKTVETLARWIHEETIILRNSREELQSTDERRSCKFNYNVVEKVNKYRHNSYTSVTLLYYENKSRTVSQPLKYENDFRHRCLCCEGNHFLDQCPEFKEKSNYDKK